MYKLLLAILFFLLAGGNACYTQDSILFVPKNQWFVKVNPLAVLETDGGIGFSVEYVLPHSKLGFQVEIQPLFFSVARNGYKFDQPKGILEPGYPYGIKLRPELRYYFKGLRSQPYYQQHVIGFGGKTIREAEPIRVYVAADFLYKNVRYYRINDFFIRDGGIQYIDPVRATYREIKQVYGFDLKVGSVSQSFPNKHLWVEAFIGIGGRLKFFNYRNLPKGATAPDRFINFFTYRTTYSSIRTTRFGVSIPAGVKLAYSF